MNESDVEKATLLWFWELGYETIFGPDIAPEEPQAERASYAETILQKRLHTALVKINPTIPADAIEEGIRKICHAESPSLIENNLRFHRFLTDGVDVEYRNTEGQIIHDKVWIVDFKNPHNNKFLAVNQFTVVESRHNRRPDIVIFVNGLPLGLIELKNPADEKATVKTAFRQIQTYKKQIPDLFHCNELVVISDGTEARIGSLTANWERHMPWRTIDGIEVMGKGDSELEVMIKGVFEKERFLDLVRNFIVYEQIKEITVKKVAGYHQFHAVNKAVACTVKASAKSGDGRAGVVWHTQGSGKSLSMAFYAGKIVQTFAMQNPTLVVLTDRNDLDDQLFGTFSECKNILRQTPRQATNRDELRELLRVASGGIVFTTIQKFLPQEKGERYPCLSERHNIVVIADEAHRSQYDFITGFAKNMRDALPNASFIGFTATPIEKADRNTPAVFGNYIDIYDIHKAIEDGATVPIYYEARLAKLGLKEEEKPKIDPDFEEVTEDQEESAKRKLQSKWSRLAVLVGTEKRIEKIAADIIEHFEKRLEAMDGKGLIVCMSRSICVDLYNAVIQLRPQWADEDDDKGFLKVVMTGSATDPVEWLDHIRDKKRRRELGDNFKDAKHPFKLAIVRDMWLTGFDVPSLHTMYIDKPMRGHGLMQAIARVNRVYKDKPGGLIVDYLGIAHEIKQALAEYSEKDKKNTGIDQETAVSLLLEKYEVTKAMFHGFDYHPFFKGSPQAKVRVVPAAMEYILVQKDGKKRFVEAVASLSKVFALAVPHQKALAIQNEVAFFQAVKAAFIKHTGDGSDSHEEMDAAIRQIVSRAVSSDGVFDIFGAAGLQKPELSILSDVFLAEMQGMEQKNLAVELLRKLLHDELKVRSRQHLVQSRSFAERLENTIYQYHNRTIEAVDIIEELIQMAKELRTAASKGEQLGLTDDEMAFYDALETNDSAVKVLGDATLCTIARELVKNVRQGISIDWTVKESARARLRVLVKKILRKYGYPPDKEEKATQTVLEQLELFGEAWAT